MKRLLVLRHAKAEPGSDGGSDSERPLARRGRRDASSIGRWLESHGGPPALIASSPALRALETAQRVAEAIGCKAAVARWPLLYPGDAASTLAALRGLDDAIGSVLLVGHNPHVEEITAVLCGGARVRMATAALALLEGDLESWRGLGPGGMVLTCLVSPEAL